MHIERLYKTKGVFTMRKSVFAISDDHNAYIGYTSGRTWNGWATPYFTLEEALKIQADWNNEYNPMTYDEVKDEFRVLYEGEDEPYIWKGEDIQTVDGVKHLYGIGAYSHIWDEFSENEQRYLAQQINDFIANYNPFEYREAFDDEDEVIIPLIEAFADLELFVKCFAIMNDERLNADQMYAKLEVLLM